MLTFAVSAMMVLILIVTHDNQVWRGGPELHTLMEVVSAIVALMAGALALARYFTRRSIRFLFLGCALFGAAFLDSAHAVVTSELMATYVPSAPTEIIPWSWSVSRFYFAFVLLLGIVLEIHLTGARRAEIIGRERFVFLSASVVCFLCLIVYLTVDLPKGYYEGLIIHRPQEFVPGLGILAALVLTLFRGKPTEDAFDNWFIVSLVLGVFTQFAFMPLSVSLFDADFDVAHLAKLLSYAALLIGLFASTVGIFRKEQEALKQLVRLSGDLSRHVRLAYHDMREPVRGIANLADWIEEDEATTLSPVSHEFLQLLKVRASRLDQLIVAFRDFADAGRHDVDIALVDVSELVRSSHRDLRGSDRFRLEIEGYLPHYWTDGIGLKTVLTCLFDNAIRHHDRGEGEIRVAVEAKGDRFVFSVQDDGPGIEPKFRDTVFEAFKSLQSKDHTEGAGIGLSVARKVVERHGGTIGIDDGAGGRGRGTTVRFEWPISTSDVLKNNALWQPESVSGDISRIEKAAA